MWKNSVSGPNDDLLKGYFHCKTVTSQNVSSEAQVKNFLFRRNVMFLSRGIQFFCIFNHPIVYQICDVVMSISTWDRSHFWISFKPHLIKSPNLVNDRHKQGQYFSKIFLNDVKCLGQVLFNLATCSNYSITKYVKFSVFHFFERVNNGDLKMVNINH